MKIDKPKKIICVYYTDDYGINRCLKTFSDFDSLYAHIKDTGHDILVIG